MGCTNFFPHVYLPVISQKFNDMLSYFISISKFPGTPIFRAHLIVSHLITTEFLQKCISKGYVSLYPAPSLLEIKLPLFTRSHNTNLKSSLHTFNNN